MSSFKLNVVLLLSLPAIFCLSSVPGKYDPVNRCGPVCAIFCEHGNKMDERGCPTCQCNQPCELVDCGNGMHCEVKQVQCITTPCPPQPICVKDEENPKCGPVCEIFCQYGNKMDERGCPTCQCNDACAVIRCHSDTPYCYNGGCHASPQTPDLTILCPGVCKRLCRSGFRKDYRGCDICQCVDPCEDRGCPSGMFCRRMQVQCLVAPCYDVAHCECYRVRCRHCRHGYVTDKNGCQTCECKRPQIYYRG